MKCILNTYTDKKSQEVSRETPLDLKRNFVRHWLEEVYVKQKLVMKLFLREKDDIDISHRTKSVRWLAILNLA